jgi:hypothetical protein
MKFAFFFQLLDTDDSVSPINNDVPQHVVKDDDHALMKEVPHRLNSFLQSGKCTSVHRANVHTAIVGIQLVEFDIYQLLLIPFQDLRHTPTQHSFTHSNISLGSDNVYPYRGMSKICKSENLQIFGFFSGSKNRSTPA